MGSLHIEFVEALPASAEPSTLYFIKKPNNRFDIYVCSLDGILRPLTRTTPDNINMGSGELSAYSTAETLTERRWIDGKPIYRKVIVIENPEGTIPAGVTPLEDMSYVDQFVGDWSYRPYPDIASGTGVWYLNSTMQTGNAYIQFYVYTDKMLYLYIATWDQVFSKITQVVEYTKLSDDENSPVRKVGGVAEYTSTEKELPETRFGQTVYAINVSGGALPNSSIKELLIPNYNPNYTYWIGGDSIAINPVNKETITINSAAGYDWVTAQIKNDKIQIMTSSNFETDGFTKTSIILKYVKTVIE